MHHPPFACGLAGFDAARLNVGANRLATIVRRHPPVERILCGHVHRPIQVRWAGTVVSAAPSTAHQATLDLAPDAALMFSMDPPAVVLHQWRPGIGLMTHLSYVGEYDGPYPFDWSMIASDGNKLNRHCPADACRPSPTGLVPAIHRAASRWMPGTSPGMTSVF